MFLFKAYYLQRYSKIMELEEELKVVGNSLKSLEVSEEKVSLSIFRDVWERVSDKQFDWLDSIRLIKESRSSSASSRP